MRNQQHVWLLTSDLHLSDRPRDRYRFGIFSWLGQMQRKYGVTATFLLGDITNEKDRHSSTLVNHIVDELVGLKPPIYWLRANHDCVSPDNPFFRFLNCIDGIQVVIYPQYIAYLNVGFIPHCRSQAEFDTACAAMPKRAYLLCHQLFDGAIAETGGRLSGLSTSAISQLKPLACYAGDVHAPQQVGPVRYVGAPYHCRMGDQYVPRVLLLRDGVETDLHFPAPRKLVLHIQRPGDITSYSINKGDHAKIIVNLDREQCVSWASIKEEVLAVGKEVGLEIHGLEMKVQEGRRKRIKLAGTERRSNANILSAFCQSEGVAENVRQVGEELIK